MNGYPHFVQQKGKQLTVVNTEPFKRHAQSTTVSKTTLEMMNRENREKLGRAIGKALATNLVVSFEEIVIHRETKHAR